MGVIEVYVSENQKEAARGYLNKMGFPTSLAQAVASTQTDEMARKREICLKGQLGSATSSDAADPVPYAPKSTERQRSESKPNVVNDDKNQLFLFA